MICTFPTLYPDEMLYSVCARYSDRMQYSCVKDVSIDLFGHRIASKVSFPNCLGHLAANIPFRENISVSNLISNHTLTPFYKPFLPSKLISDLKERMEANETKPIQALVGFRNRISSGTCRHFCYRCVEEDRKQFGECYWHRVHQIPYVEVCPHHNIQLNDSALYSSLTSSKFEFISAEKVIDNITHKLPKIINNTCDEFSWIARDALWLLENPTTENLQSVQKRYPILLANQKWATYAGRVEINKLQQAFQQHYDHTILRQFHCELADSDHNWFTNLPHNSTKVIHPVRHLLFMHFLGYTVENFLALPAEKQPFGSGPWPCLNPVCPHYKKRCIHTCEVIYKHGIDGKPRGKFSCECGFTYSRKGPDLSDACHFQANPVKVYGNLWETKLKELLEDSDMSLTQIARILEVDWGTLKKQMQKLGLSSSRLSDKSQVSQVKSRSQNTHVANDADKSLKEANRAEWLSVRKDNPNDGVMLLQSKVPRAYKWLYNHDREWLRINKPTIVKKRIPPHPHMDWEQRDIQFAAEVKSTALRIKNAETHPTRMTIAAITKNTLHGHIIHSNINKLPLTAKTLDDCTETYEEFALCRVQWLKSYYIKENICPTRTQFMVKGSFWKSQTLWSSVKEAVDEALQVLNANKL